MLRLDNFQKTEGRIQNSEFRIRWREGRCRRRERRRLPAGARLVARVCVLVLAVAAVQFLSGCTSRAPEQPAAKAGPAKEPEVVALAPEAVREGRVRWEPAKTSTIPEMLRVTGRITVDENRTSRVGSIVDGRIAEIFANVGDLVSKDQVLARLVSHEVHDARAEYAKARAELSRRQAELEFARNASKRASRLYELKAASLEQVQKAQADLRSAEFGVTVARTEVNRVAEQIRHLGLSTESAEEEYTRAIGSDEKEGFEEDELVPVMSPIEGTVLQRFVSPGTVVTPANDLMLISDLNVLWVNAQVPEKYLPALKTGRPVGITVQAYGDRVFPGRIAHIEDTLDPATRTVGVRCETRNQEGKLKPEMYATVIFEVGEVQDALLIPTEAIQDINGQMMVFVREGETKFRAKKIKIGRQVESQSEILEGLSPGELIVVTGSFLLKSELLKSSMSEE